MTQLENNDILISLYNKLDVRLRVIFVASFLWGIFAHGMALFNKYSIHDDIVCLFNVGVTYRSGRWFLEILSNGVKYLFLSSHFSLPVINGTFSITCIAISAYLIINLLDIKSKSACITISGIMVTFPSIASLFGYMFTAPYYMFASLLAIVGAYLLCVYRKWYTYILGIFIISCAIGVYQANLSLSICVIALFFMRQLDTATLSWRQYFKQALYYMSACVLSLCLYFFFSKLTLNYYNAELLAYKGINTMWQVNIHEFVDRIIYAYTYYINPVGLSFGGETSIFPMRGKTLYYMSLIVSFIIWIYKIYQHFVLKSYLQATQMTLLLIVWPVISNIIFVMCPPSLVSAMMSYSLVIHFIIFSYLIEQVNQNNKKHCRIIYTFGIIILISTSIIYARYDNIFYLKLEFAQERAISYATTLVAKIKNIKGYSDEYPVVFIGNGPDNDKSLEIVSPFNDVILPPVWTLNDGIKRYSWISIMRLWCAYAPSISSPDQFESNTEVMAMPSYPNDGSIKIIDNTVVVKF